MDLDLIYASTFGELELFQKRKNQEIKYDRRRDSFVVYHLLNVHLKKGKGIKYEELLYDEDKDEYKKAIKESNDKDKTTIGTPEEMDFILGGEPVKGVIKNPQAAEVKKRYKEIIEKKYGKR